ncbi:MAG TPA: hypothetical protein VJ984_00065, partial [Xanthomonadales bacterium]|nr:hypothetical protein [Xanthomonadales bacterium]
MKRLILIAAIIGLFWSVTAPADSTEAACNIYPAGQDHGDRLIPCTFSQRQGYITIRRSDDVTHD